MNKIGQKIREIRKKKGWSQEELAEHSKLNLRTIQRIENGESEPRGKTLHLICKVLDVHVENLLDYGKQIDKNYLVMFHLSVLAFLALPLGNILVPLILWMSKRDKITGLYEAGVNLLNFQILWTVVSFLSIFFFAFFKISHMFSYNRFLLYIYLFLFVSNIFLSIRAAIKAKRGEVKGYPEIVQWIK